MGLGSSTLVQVQSMHGSLAHQWTEHRPPCAHSPPSHRPLDLGQSCKVADNRLYSKTRPRIVLTSQCSIRFTPSASSSTLARISGRVSAVTTVLGPCAWARRAKTRRRKHLQENSTSVSQRGAVMVMVLIRVLLSVTTVHLRRLPRLLSWAGREELPLQSLCTAVAHTRLALPIPHMHAWMLAPIAWQIFLPCCHSSLIIPCTTCTRYPGPCTLVLAEGSGAGPRHLSPGLGC